MQMDTRPRWAQGHSRARVIDGKGLRGASPGRVICILTPTEHIASKLGIRVAWRPLFHSIHKQCCLFSHRGCMLEAKHCPGACFWVLFFDENAFLETCTSQVSAVPTWLTLHISLGVVCGGQALL